jgi:hypothetical protein
VGAAALHRLMRAEDGVDGRPQRLELRRGDDGDLLFDALCCP